MSHRDATRCHTASQTVSINNSASASASASACTRKEPESRLEPVPLTRAEWDHLLEERLGIMHDAGMTLARAQALALADTHRAHGPRPGEVA